MRLRRNQNKSVESSSHNFLAEARKLCEKDSNVACDDLSGLPADVAVTLKALCLLGRDAACPNAETRPSNSH